MYEWNIPDHGVKQQQNKWRVDPCHQFQYEISDRSVMYLQCFICWSVLYLKAELVYGLNTQTNALGLLWILFIRLNDHCKPLAKLSSIAT